MYSSAKTFVLLAAACVAPTLHAQFDFNMLDERSRFTASHRKGLLTRM